MGLAIAAAGVLCFGFGLQFFALKFRRRAMPYFVLFLFVAWFLPLMVAGLLGHSFGSSVAETMFSVSPIVGVVLPTSTSLVVNGLLALAFGTMLLTQERELEESVRGGRAVVA